jgi:hypothetical protein
VPEQRLLSSKICRRRWWRCGTLLKFLLTPLGFSVPRLLIGEGASSGVAPGLLTPCQRGPGVGCASIGWGRPVAPPLRLFGSLEASGKNKTLGCRFVQFWKYFLCITSETQKQQKTRNWHCGTLLIG